MTRIAFNGNSVFEGTLDTHDSLSKLDGVVRGYTTLATTAEDYKSSYAKAAARLVNFLKDHEAEMATMGLSVETYMSDASHAKDLAAATKRAEAASNEVRHRRPFCTLL